MQQPGEAAQQLLCCSPAARAPLRGGDDVQGEVHSDLGGATLALPQRRWAHDRKRDLRATFSTLPCSGSASIACDSVRYNHCTRIR